MALISPQNGVCVTIARKYFTGQFFHISNLLLLPAHIIFNLLLIKANSTYTIARWPEMFIPISFLKFRKLIHYFKSTLSFQISYHLTYLPIWRYFKHQINMINAHITCCYFEFFPGTEFSNRISNIVSNISIHNTISMFWNPFYMQQILLNFDWITSYFKLPKKLMKINLVF